jgi:hypothetical protein
MNGPNKPMSPREIEALMSLARSHGILPMGAPDEIAAALNSQRPKIRLPGDNRELGQFAREIGEILRGQDLYRRDRSAVTVNVDKQRLDPMDADCLRTWAETHLVCFKDKEIGQGSNAHVIQIVKTMNRDTALGALKSYQLLDQLQEIERLNPTRMPTILRDGRIELMPVGYFAERKIYTTPDDDLTYNEAMTIEEAKSFLDDLLHEFCFHDESRSKSVALAAMLTMFCAAMLPRRALRPGFVYTANSPGAGKTLLAKIAIIPVAKSASPRSMPRKEEMKKVLDVIAMDAATYVIFDNIRGQIGGEEIEAFITASEWEGRILGESTKFRVDNVATCFFTGNESRPSQDMAERCLFVDLFVQEADNRDRKINRVIDDTFLATPECRSQTLSALWTLVKAWDAGGRPKPPSVLPRFEQWSAVVAAIVAHAGYGDCCVKPDIASARGDVQEMRKLILHLAPHPDSPDPREEWNFSQIIEEVKKEGFFEGIELRTRKGEVEEVFSSSDGELTMAGRSHFGRMFARFDQRLFAGDDGRRMRFVVEGKGNTRKYIVLVESEPPAPQTEEVPTSPVTPF